MKKHLFFALAMLCAMAVSANEQFSVGSLSYLTTDDGYASVTGLADKTAKSIVIPESVTYGGKKYLVYGIEPSAFKNSKLTSVVVDSKYFCYIGVSAFKNSTIEEVQWWTNGENVQICNGAFQGCSNLVHFILPLSVESIGWRAFAECTSLKSINIQDTKYIDSDCFSGCTSLSHIIWNNTRTDSQVTDLSGNKYDFGQQYKIYPFDNLRSQITKVTASGVIFPCLFIDMPNLATVDLQNVKTIGERAFEGCTGLKQLLLNNNTDLETIGMGAFANSPIENDIYIYSNKLKLIGIAAFASLACKQVTIDAFSSEGLEIHSGAFRGETVSKAILNVTNLKSLAAFRCPNLTELFLSVSNDFAPSLESADRSPFSELTKLKYLNINTKGTVTNYMFANCSALETLNISAKNVEPLAFGTADKLQSVLWNVTAPQDYTANQNPFANASQIKTVSFGSSVTRIPDYLFYFKDRITQVEIPETVTEVGHCAFRFTNITSLTVPAGVKTLGVQAFGAYNLENITYNAVSAALKTTNMPSFEGSDQTIFGIQAKSLTIGSAVSSLPKWFMNQNLFGGNLKSVTLPESLTAIGEEAFATTNLGSIRLPSKLKTLGARAFASSNVKSVTISGNVPAPGDAFENCVMLNTIYCNCNNESDVQSKWSSVCSNIVSQGTGDYPLPAIDESYMTGKGSVEWGAQNGCDPNRTLTAKPNTEAGYKFVQWSDGETANPRTINLQTFNFDGPFYAEFASESDYVKFNVTAVPADGATFSFYNAANGSRLNKDEILASQVERVRIVPTIKSGYEFISWEYESSSAVTESENSHQLWVNLKVKNYPTDFTLNLKAPIRVTVKRNSNLGTVSALDNNDGTWTITASANFGCKFVGWDDDENGTIDNKESVRTVIPTASVTYTAYFEYGTADPDSYSVYVITRGGYADVVNTNGSLTSIAKGETVSLYAEPGANTVFVGWYNVYNELLSTDNPYTFVAGEAEDCDPNGLYTFYLELEYVDPYLTSYPINIMLQPEGAGTVSANIELESDGFGQSMFGSVPADFDLQLTAEPYDGYEFDSWQYIVAKGEGDFITSNDNPLFLHTPVYDEESFVMVEVMVTFRPVGDGVENIESKEPVRKIVREGQVLILRGDKVYNVLGTEVK